MGVWNSEIWVLSVYLVHSQEMHYTITTRSIDKQTVFQSSSEYREHTHINILILRRWEQQSGILANSVSVLAICQECVGNGLQVVVRYKDIYCKLRLIQRRWLYPGIRPKSSPRRTRQFIRPTAIVTALGPGPPAVVNLNNPLQMSVDGTIYSCERLSGMLNVPFKSRTNESRSLTFQKVSKFLAHWRSPKSSSSVMIHEQTEKNEHWAQTWLTFREFCFRKRESGRKQRVRVKIIRNEVLFVEFN
jgi:hypothetical protein